MLVLSSCGNNLKGFGWGLYFACSSYSFCGAGHSLHITLQSDLTDIKENTRSCQSDLYCVYLYLIEQTFYTTCTGRWQMKKIKRIKNSILTPICLLSSLKIVTLHDMFSNYSHFILGKMQNKFKRVLITKCL